MLDIAQPQGRGGQFRASTRSARPAPGRLPPRCPCRWSAPTAVPTYASSPSSPKPPRWRGFSTTLARRSSRHGPARPARLGRPDRRGRTRRGRPSPTATRVRLRPAGSHLPSPGRAGEGPRPAPAMIVPPASLPSTLPNGGVAPRRLPSARTVRLQSTFLRCYVPPDPSRPQPPCGWITYPSLPDAASQRGGAWRFTVWPLVA